MILLQRYFFNQLLWPLITAIVAFAALALLTQSLSNVDLISGYSGTALTFLKVTILALPHLMAILVPIALFIAILVGLNGLVAESELLVGSAAGMSRWDIMAPVMRLAVYVLIANLVVNLFVQPLSYREMRRTLYDLRSDVAASLITPGAFTELGSGVTIYARERLRNGGMADIMIHDSRLTDAGSSTYTAREGFIVRTEESSSMVLVDGNLQQIDPAGELSYGEFERYEFDLGEFVGPVDAIFFKESDRFLHELLWPDGTILSRQGGLEEARAEAHYRLSSPLYNIALAFIAVAAFMVGDYSRLGYGRRIMIAAVAALFVRLLGFSAASAAADDQDLNYLQYVVPLIGILVPLLMVYLPRRDRTQRPAPAAQLAEA